MIFSLAQPMGWDCLIVGISLAEVIMTNIAYFEIVLLLFRTLFDIESRS
jgi:hypothetical protein